MSNFFKALDQAERDGQRARGEAEPAVEGHPAAAPGSAEPAPVDFPPPTGDRAASASLRVDEHLVMLTEPESPEAEQFRGLRNYVERMVPEAGALVLAVSSPLAGDGKTLIAINLAVALSEGGRNPVLLIDADLRKSAISERLGLTGREPGIREAVAASRTALEELAWRTPWGHLEVLFAGRAAGQPYEILQSPTMAELVDQARRRYTFVIVDTPPVLPLADCRVIDTWVDGFLLVASAHQTPREAIDDTLRILDPKKVPGVIFNGADGFARGRAYRYYYSHHGSEESRTSRMRRLLGWLR